MRPVQTRARRGAKTARGRETRTAILTAARRMCSEQWLDQLSLAELARAAGTTRASVLFQFPDGWPDIAADLRIEELQRWADEVDVIAESRRKSLERLRDALLYVVKQGEETGALLPNLRAFNLVWGDAIDARVLPMILEIGSRLALLLSAACRGEPTATVVRTSADMLFAFALDLATMPYYRRLRLAEREAELETAIALALKGLNEK